MTEYIKLHVAGKASTKQRQRFDPRTKRAYTPPSNIISENDVRAVWREEGEPRLDDGAAICLQVVVNVERPSGHFRRDGELSAEGQRHPVPRNKKPDLDNLIKLIMDALNSRAYRDDVQIASVTAIRLWGKRASTEIFLETMRAPRYLGYIIENAMKSHAA